MATYSRVYRIGLLDDLHNYFPELLYNIESFNTVQDVLQYIRTRTIRRFNIFDNAMREYTNTNHFTNPQNVVHRYEDTDQSFLIPLISSLDSISLLRPRGVLHEDVIVHASEDMINQVSTRTTLLVDADENCSICQDQMKTDESIRTLRGCGHVFHTSCIDLWLLNRSVLCPSCRHDIREDLELRESREARESRNPDSLPSDFINSMFLRRQF